MMRLGIIFKYLEVFKVRMIAQNVVKFWIM